MIIRVTQTGAITLLDPDDFKKFHVDAGGQSRSIVDQALRACEAGEVDGEHAFISEAWLARVGNPLTELPDWTTQLSGMVAYATTRGWVSTDGARLQAHIENAQ